MWKELHASLTIKPPYGKELPIPKDADLDKAEKAIGAKLPPSYREYAKQFGYGEHGGYFRINVPLGAKFPNADLAGHVAKAREGFAGRAKTAKDKAAFQRLIPFGSTVGGDSFFFDPEGAKSAEYPVVAVIKGELKIQKAAKDFPAFMEDIVYGQGLKKLTGSKQEMVVIKEFTPYGDKVRGL